METLYHYLAPPHPCNYLPGETARMEYEVVRDMTPAEYLQRLEQGWRRFGHMLFRPRCSDCVGCRSLRVIVNEFQPNRSQRRTRQVNADTIRLVLGEPRATAEKLDLYDRFHAFQVDNKGWPEHAPRDVYSYNESFVHHPFPTLECCFYLEGRLVGVGYADDLPGGMSAIYFYYDPDERSRALGVWNVLCLIDECRRRGVPYLYLGYYVEGCSSLEYKANYEPNEIIDVNRQRWELFRG